MNTCLNPNGASRCSGTYRTRLIMAMAFHDISLVRVSMTLSKLKAHKIPIYFLWHYGSA